jgi:hypothetical protein
MKCKDCPFYRESLMWNGCGVTGDECFHTQECCDLVNDDGEKMETEDETNS